MTKSDLIVRSAAIEAVAEDLASVLNVSKDETRELAEHALSALSSAEPTAEEVWSVAQKVFYSTLTYREAVDYLKEVEEQHERFNQQSRCDRGGGRIERKTAEVLYPIQ